MSITREQQEELLELCWTAAEDGISPLDRDRLPAQLVCFLPHPIEPAGQNEQGAIDGLLAEGLLSADGRRVELSASGRQAAREIVRRHRLTEVLLHSVLNVSDASVEATACQVEHILNAEVTDAVCAFLGHPPSCPHGRAIPSGACCARAEAIVEPLIVPLGRLAVGEQASIALIHSARPGYLQRLSAFGVAPGRHIRLRQTRPALVIQIGETELGLDQQAAREIFVRRRAR
jgi:DtxR family Mn-dependent transcriptional regulator